MMNNQKRAIITGVAIIVICTIVFVLLTGRESPTKKVAELLDLGNKYLTEQDYEQAVVAFQEVIEIDPKCEEAYRGLADVYIAMGDYEKACDILRQGIEQTNSEELTAYLEEVREICEDMQKEQSMQEDLTEDEEDEVEIAEIEIEEDIEYFDNGYRVYEYDDSGNLVKMTFYPDDMGPFDLKPSVYEFEYDENGEWLSTTFENAVMQKVSTREVLTRHVHEYDEDMNEIRYTFYGENEEVFTYRESKYEFDTNGQCVLVETYYDGDGNIFSENRSEYLPRKKVRYADGRVRFEQVK